VSKPIDLVIEYNLNNLGAPIVATKHLTLYLDYFFTSTEGLHDDR